MTPAGELEALGIDLIATEQSIDTRTPVGRFTFTTLGAVAELAGPDPRGGGHCGGAAKGSAGLRADPRRVRELLQGGASAAAVARLLRVSRTAIRRARENSCGVVSDGALVVALRPALPNGPTTAIPTRGVAAWDVAAPGGGGVCSQYGSAWICWPFPSSNLE